MKKLLIALTIMLSALLTTPSFAAAQQGVQNDPSLQAPTDETIGEPGAGTTTRNDDMSWWWILPVLAIPLLLLLFRRDKSEDDQRDMGTTRDSRDQRFAGTKGGEARRSSDEDMR